MSNLLSHGDDEMLERLVEAEAALLARLLHLLVVCAKQTGEFTHMHYQIRTYEYEYRVVQVQRTEPVCAP